MSRKISKLDVFIVLLFIAWSLYQVYKASFIAIDGNRYFYLSDDAMISMRYAWNFSHGRGLVWNIGEHVEGYSNLLMTLIMSVATALFDKKTAALAVQLLGIPTVLCAAFLTRRIARQLYSAHPSIASLAFIAALFYFPLMYWSLSGMETGLLTVLLLAGFLYGLFWLEHGRHGHLFLSSMFLGLAFLTRNDSILFAVLIFGYLAYKKWSSPQKGPEFLLLFYALLFYGVFVAGQTIFRLAYYGEFVPNTYTLKVTGVPLSVKLRWGLTFIVPFLFQSSVLLAVAVIEIIRTRFKNLILILFLGVALAYQVSVGGDPWAEWRIMTPAMPFVFILAASAFVGIGAWLQRSTNTRQAGTISGITPTVLLLLNLLLINLPFSSYIYSTDQDIRAYLSQHTTNLAIAINALTTKDASIGVLWAGAIPYYADRRAIDFLGKSDKYIASLPAHLDMHLPGHNKFDLGYSIRTLQPTYIQNFEWDHENEKPWVVEHYLRVNYRTGYGDITLILRQNDPSVHWDLGEIIPWPEKSY